jgi:hypothetical protein
LADVVLIAVRFQTVGSEVVSPASLALLRPACSQGLRSDLPADDFDEEF